MSIMYDVCYCEADKQIDIIKDYLERLDECDIDKIGELAENLKWFIKNYIETEQEE